MATVYDRADIYDLIENEERFAAYRRHWERVLDGTGVRSLLDVSIGSGGVTLPLGVLGVELSGSDLSQAMLDSCGPGICRRPAAERLPRPVLLAGQAVRLRGQHGQFPAIRDQRRGAGRAGPDGRAGQTGRVPLL